jgi:hypothetical protein
MLGYYTSYMLSAIKIRLMKPVLHRVPIKVTLMKPDA